MMNGNNKIKTELIRAASRNRAAALRSSSALVGMAGGVLMASPLIPESIFLYERIASLLTDAMGEISLSGRVIAGASAFGAVVASTLAIDRWLSPVFARSAPTRAAALLGFVALAVVTINPALGMLQEAGLANGGIGAPGGDTAQITGVLVSALLLPLMAIIGGLGAGHFARSFGEWRACGEAARHSRRQGAAAQAIAKSERYAALSSHALAEREARMKRVFTEHMRNAAFALAGRYELYLKGEAPSPSPSSFREQLEEQVFARSSEVTPALRQMISLHLPELILCPALPRDGRELSDAARGLILKHASWIRTAYSQQAIRAGLKTHP